MIVKYTMERDQLLLETLARASLLLLLQEASEYLDERLDLVEGILAEYSLFKDVADATERSITLLSLILVLVYVGLLLLEHRDLVFELLQRFHGFSSLLLLLLAHNQVSHAHE